MAHPSRREALIGSTKCDQHFEQGARDEACRVVIAPRLVQFILTNGLTFTPEKLSEPVFVYGPP